MIAGDKWMIHAIAVPKLIRTIHHVCKAKGWTKEDPKSVMRTEEEMVHVHDVYRLKVTGLEGKVLWHRGAKVGVVT